MTKFDWEKDPYAKIIRHQKSRQTQKNYLKKKAANLIKKERELQTPYQSGVAVGRELERERIIKLLEAQFEQGDEHVCPNCDIWLEIKGEQK